MRRKWLIIVLFLSGVPGGLDGQVVWDSPAMIQPGAPAGLSILLIEPHPGNEFGGLVMWRGQPAPVGLGFRGGIVEDAGGDVTGVLGLDLSGTLASPGSDGQPQVLWWTGAGIGFADEVIASFPLGVVLGWRATDESVTFMPYVGGHLALDVRSGPGDDLDLDGAVDLGMDLGFGSGFMVRFGAAVGGRDAFAIGVRLPG